MRHPFFAALALCCLLLVTISACKEEVPAGPQYTLSESFKACTYFPLGTKWVYRDSASGEKFLIQLITQQRDSLAAGPGYAGYLYYRWGYRLRADTTLIVPDTANLTIPDSLPQVGNDTVPGRIFRVLPFTGAMAGSLLDTIEKHLFFHYDSIRVGDRQGLLTYQGQSTVSLPLLGQVAGAFHFRHDLQPNADSLSIIETQFAPGRGLVRFRTPYGRTFLLDSLKLP